MPKPEHEQREDELLDLVCSKLSRDGRQVVITDRPDRRPPSDVPPVDAIVRVVEGEYGQLWAADVCLVSKKFDPRIPAAMRELSDALLPSLVPLAEKLGKTLRLLCRAYVRPDNVSGKEWQILMREYYTNIFDRAIMAMTRPTGEWTDAEVSILWLNEDEKIEERVRISYSDPFINESFAFAPKVRKKLGGQLLRAREAGYPTLLILDQVAPNYVPWISNTLPEPYEIGEGIAFAVAHLRTRLDAGVLVNDDENVHEVYGRVGKAMQPLLCPRCGGRSESLDSRHPMLRNSP